MLLNLFFYLFSVGWQLHEQQQRESIAAAVAAASKVNNVDDDDELKAICDEER